MKEVKKMNKIIELISIKNADIRDYKNENNDKKREYVRLTFNAVDKENDLDIIVKTSLSLNQWDDLVKAMNIEYNSLIEEMTTGNKLTLEVNTKEMTKSNNPKLLWDEKKGSYKGIHYNYFEMNVGVLIINKIVLKENYKKDLSKLFKNIIKSDEIKTCN